MARRNTAFERYVRTRMKDPVFAKEYAAATEEIAATDALMQQLDKVRARAAISKGELARKAKMPAVSVRRLFTTKNANPSVKTLDKLARPLGLRVALAKLRA